MYTICSTAAAFEQQKYGEFVWDVLFFSYTNQMYFENVSCCILLKVLAGLLQTKWCRILLKCCKIVGSRPIDPKYVKSVKMYQSRHVQWLSRSPGLVQWLSRSPGPVKDLSRKTSHSWKLFSLQRLHRSFFNFNKNTIVHNTHYLPRYNITNIIFIRN